MLGGGGGGGLGRRGDATNQSHSWPKEPIRTQSRIVRPEPRAGKHG